MHVKLLAKTEASTEIWLWKMIGMIVMIMNSTRAKTKISFFLHISKVHLLQGNACVNEEAGLD